MSTSNKGTGRAQTRALDVTVSTQRRKQILQAASDCIVEDGVEKLTLRKVAERAQVSHATIAYYFNSRRELLDSALLEMSADFLDNLRLRARYRGTRDLHTLATAFLDPDNPTARFVVQMIDAGLHDPGLRSSHDDFLGYGRERIRKSIEVGIQKGELREDLDPELAARLFHSVLIWWESEILAGAIPADEAQEVAAFVISLFSRSGAEQQTAATAVDAPASSTMDVIESELLNDPNLSNKAAQSLATAFRSLYAMASDLSAS